MLGLDGLEFLVDGALDGDGDSSLLFALLDDQPASPKLAPSPEGQQAEATKRDRPEAPDPPSKRHEGPVDVQPPAAARSLRPRAAPAAEEEVEAAGPWCLHSLAEGRVCRFGCDDAPPVDQYDDWELCGDKGVSAACPPSKCTRLARTEPLGSTPLGRKNGAKLLRSLLKKTSLWKSRPKRQLLSSAAAEAGFGRIVDACDGGNITKLRKVR